MKSLRILLAAVPILLMLIGCPLGLQEDLGNATDVSVMQSRVPGRIHTFTGSEVIPLYAGGGNRASARLVGSVTLNVAGSEVLVRYDLMDSNADGAPDIFPWIVSEVHFAIADQLAQIPVNRSGNPVPGAFTAILPVDPNRATIEFKVALPPDANGDGQYFVAAHASVVYYGGIEGFAFYLPNDPVTMRVTYPAPGVSSYFKVLLSGAGLLNGEYDGWCVDVGDVIYENTDYPVMLYSSYESLPAGAVDRPENLDLVNWLVNHFAAGQAIPELGGYVLTYGDLQRAIWALIDFELTDAGLGSWNQAAVDFIVAAAQANGEGWVPGCNDKIALVLVPEDIENVQVVIAQTTIATVLVPCTTQGETAWADGKEGLNFPGANSWATYFTWHPLVP